jgi:hypothetical protein
MPVVASSRGSTALGGLYLLAIWLIGDRALARCAAGSVPVISGHVLFAVSGLVLADVPDAGETSPRGDCRRPGFVATFGLTMAVRWIGVYHRSLAAPPRTR